MQMITLKPYQPGDEQSIVHLLNEAENWPGFVHQGTVLDFWRWRYQDNPYGKGAVSLAKVEERALSHAASLPVELKLGEAKRRGAQMSDLLTRSEARGQKLMERAIQVVRELDEARGTEMEFAFPSPPGYEIGLKIGFFEAPLRMGQYELIANPSGFFKNVPHGHWKRLAYEGMRRVKGRRGLEEDIQVAEVGSFPEDIGSLISRFEQDFTFLLHRSEAYLNWRYANPVAGKFRILVARKEEVLSGFLVVRPYSIAGQNYMDIVDLVSLVGDSATLKALIDKSVDICLAERADTIQIWLPTDHPYLPDLGREGFLLRQPKEGERRVRMICRPLEDTEKLTELLTGGLRYHIVLGDSDWV